MGDYKNQTLLDHLKERHLSTRLYPTSIIVNETDVSFLLYNQSGQMVGYQIYNPNTIIKQSNNPREARYFTYTSGEEAGYWGSEFDFMQFDYVFIVEGVFDAARLHSLGHPALAVLGRDPKKLRSFLLCLTQRKIVLADGDKAGKDLIKYGDSSAIMPNGLDVSDVDETTLISIIKSLL